MSAPGLDIQLVGRLGLNRSVERTCINFMGCYAGINAIKTAYHISRSEPEAVVLLAGVELCTLHYQKNEKEDQIIANALFADGASACIISSQKIPSVNDSRALSLKNFYAEFEPGDKEEMAWRIGDHGFDLRLSSYVPGLLKKSIPEFMTKLFDRAHVKQEDISFFAFHPGGVKILEACEEALHITKKENEIAYHVLHDYGNMSSVTIFFVLKEFLESFTTEDAGKKLLACAFGPGLTMESMIAEIC
jgi:predicted naringenin-chalcone synthase